jgi:hypothetical protein
MIIIMQRMIKMKWILEIFKKKEFKQMMRIMIRLKPKGIITGVAAILSTFLKTNEYKN